MHEPSPSSIYNPSLDGTDYASKAQRGLVQTGRYLSANQVKAARLIADGLHYSEVASRLRIGRATLYRWRQDPHFSAYVAQFIHETADVTTHKSRGFIRKALSRVAQALDTETDPQRQLQLSLQLLRIYTRPAYLRYLAEQPADPEIIANRQLARIARSRHDHRRQQYGTMDFEYLATKHRQLFERAEAFDRDFPEEPIQNSFRTSPAALA